MNTETTAPAAKSAPAGALATGEEVQLVRPGREEPVPARILRAYRTGRVVALVDLPGEDPELIEVVEGAPGEPKRIYRAAEPLPERALSLNERLAEAEARGERIPRLGLEMAALLDAADRETPRDQFRHPVPVVRRGRVRRILDLDRVELALFEGASLPDDPRARAAEAPVETVGLRIGRPAELLVVGRAYFVEDLPTFDVTPDEVAPLTRNDRCRRCNVAAYPTELRLVSAAGGERLWLCRGCGDAVRDAIKPPAEAEAGAYAESAADR